MSTSIEEPWSPEPELREPPPRRLQPSEHPDLNVPNVSLFRIIGGTLLVLGVVLLVLGMSGRGTGMIIAGVIAAAGGAVGQTLPARKAAQARARAERLVTHGQPVMARIVSASNLTGDSLHGRVVTYMMTLPGGDVVRRDVNADERVLPKQIPGNVTALIDPADTRDVELYCALPFRAVSRPAPDPVADPPVHAPGEPQMGTVDVQQQTQSQQQSASGYQGLPWE